MSQGKVYIICQVSYQTGYQPLFIFGWSGNTLRDAERRAARGIEVYWRTCSDYMKAYTEITKRFESHPRIHRHRPDCYYISHDDSGTNTHHMIDVCNQYFRQLFDQGVVPRSDTVLGAPTTPALPATAVATPTTPALPATVVATPTTPALPATAVATLTTPALSATATSSMILGAIYGATGTIVIMLLILVIQASL